MRVRPDRVSRLVQRLEEVVDEGSMPASIAASINGKLQFTLSWAFGRFGRAALQPLTEAMSSRGAWRGGPLTAGQRASLRFFVSILPELPKHVVRLAEMERRPSLLLSDARWEEDDDDPAAIGFLLATPRPGCPAKGPTERGVAAGLAFLHRHYDFVHGSAVVPESFMQGFVRRKQQIGQLEILAGLVPYLSVPTLLSGREVIHWIDNTSAKAALVHGYSGVPDSARLVHAFHAHNLVLQAQVWFEWVPSKANPSDEPSRVDWSDRRWAVCGQIVSEPVLAPCSPRMQRGTTRRVGHERPGSIAEWCRALPGRRCRIDARPLLEGGI